HTRRSWMPAPPTPPRRQAPMSDNGAGDIGVDIEASFKLELGRLSDSVDKLHRELAARKRLMPMDFDAQGSGTYPASGALVVSPGENLSVVITGGTAGLVYVAHAYVLDYPLDVELGPLGGTI